MSAAAPSNTEAKKDQLVGSVKENVGYAVGNQSLESEGKAQNSAGKVQETAANVQASVQNAADKATGVLQDALQPPSTSVEAKKDQAVGNVKQTAGRAVGNERLQAEGQAQNNAGVIQETAASLQNTIQHVADQVYDAVTNAYNGGSGPSKVDGKKDQAVGNVKETTGSAVGNEHLQAEGQAQNAVGSIQNKAASVQGYVQGVADQVSGAVQGAYNALTGNTTGEAESKFQEKKGETQQFFNSKT